MALFHLNEIGLLLYLDIHMENKENKIEKVAIMRQKWNQPNQRTSQERYMLELIA